MADIFFTFQYVSINTGSLGIGTSCLSPLHSNMFLLIPATDYLSGQPLIFTFQYVSITTGAYHDLTNAKAPLHSNMFLLIPRAS